MTRTDRTICYVGATERGASDGAAALESADDAMTAVPVGSVEDLREQITGVDCVVFAETPTTAEGSHLLEVLEICGETPLVLFSEAAYGPTTARSTDGIAGYVRRESENRYAHLADEIHWVCHEPPAVDADSSEQRTSPESPDETSATSADIVAAEPAFTRPAGRTLLADVLQIGADVLPQEPATAFEDAVDMAGKALAVERCWIGSIRDGEIVASAASTAAGSDEIEAPRIDDDVVAQTIQSADPILIEDTSRERIDHGFEGCRSLLSASIGDDHVFQATAEPAHAFDETDRNLIATLCTFLETVRERATVESELRTERDRLADRRDRLQGRCNDLQIERERLLERVEYTKTELDRLETLFEHDPHPTVGYVIEGDDPGTPIVSTANPAFTEMFEPAGKSVHGVELHEILLQESHSSEGGECDRLLEALRAGMPCEHDIRREIDGTIRELRLSVVPPATTGIDDGLLVIDDITESRRRKCERDAVTDRIDAIGRVVDEEVDEFLNHARGYLEVAEETGDPDHFAEIDDAHARLRNRFDQLLALATRETPAIETEPVGLHELVKQSWVAVDPTRAELYLGRDATIEADPERLQALFEHLIRLVIEGTSGDRRDESVPSVVSIGATGDGVSVTGHIGDDPNGKLEHDVDPEPVPAADGNGFRFGFVERIADAHGWTVGVSETEGKIAVSIRGEMILEPVRR